MSFEKFYAYNIHLMLTNYLVLHLLLIIRRSHICGVYLLLEVPITPKKLPGANLYLHVNSDWIIVFITWSYSYRSFY